MPLHGHHLIAGRATAARPPSFHGINAATGQPLAPGFSESSPAEIDAALTAAAAAGADYGRATGIQRAEFLERIATEIEAIGDPLLQRAHEETGLPLPRLTGERARTCGQLRLFAQVAREGSWVDARIDPALPDRKPLPRLDIRRMLQPLGPVIVFGSSNFPLAFSVAGGDTASALATGNCVIVKAHRSHPGTGELVGEAINRAVVACGLPAGVFSLLHGHGRETGLALVRHPLATAVGFTGSLVAGRALFDAAAQRPRPIPVFSEMSSINPVFLLAGALQERGPAIAEGLKNSFTLGVGQFCTKPGLVFGVDSPAWRAFGAAVATQAATVAPGIMLHAAIAEAFKAGVGALGQVEWLAQGAAPVARVSAAVFATRPELAHEIFGPFTLLVTVPDEAGLLAIAQNLDGQLTATLHGTANDLAGAGPLVALLEQRAGRLLVNGWPTGVEVCPAMNHGGPYPATSDTRFTSVGTAALYRFVRPVCYQNFPENLLPVPLRNRNTLGLLRMIDGKASRDDIA